MCVVGVFVRRYIDILILLIPTPLLSALFCCSISTLCLIFKMFFVLVVVIRWSRAKVVPVATFLEPAILQIDTAARRFTR